MSRRHAIHEFLLDSVAAGLRRARLGPAPVPADLDLIDSGVIDSLGFIELIAAIERRFSITLDFGNRSPSVCTRLNVLADCIEEQLDPPKPTTTIRPAT